MPKTKRVDANKIPVVTIGKGGRATTDARNVDEFRKSDVPQRELEPKSRKKLVAFCIILGFTLCLAFIPIFIVYFSNAEMVLSGKGYRASVKASIVPINIYSDHAFIPPHTAGLSPKTAGYLPNTAGSPQLSVLYLEDFEGGSTNWTANTTSGMVTSPKYAILHGNKAYFFSRNGVANLSNTAYTFGINDTLDISFYCYASQTIASGYLSFRFNASWGDQKYTFEYVINQGGSGYPTPSSPYLINKTLTGFTSGFYTGFLIQDIRASVWAINSSAEDITISNMSFVFRDSPSGMSRIYLDYIQIQQYGINGISAYWYIGSNRVTSYFLSVSYDIRIDNTTLNETSVGMQLVVMEDVSISSPAQSLLDRLFETVVLTDLNWTDYSSGIFTRQSTGNYNSIVHPFPFNPPKDVVWTFSFDATLSVFASPINPADYPVTAQTTKSLTGFAVTASSPIYVG